MIDLRLARSKPGDLIAVAGLGENRSFDLIFGWDFIELSSSACARVNE
jgi:hypothetical protein